MSWAWAMPRLLAAGLAVWLMAGVPAAARAEERAALLIGNSAYAGAEALPNNENDVRAMTEVLRDLGFQVTAKANLGRAQMLAEVESFARRVKAMSGGVAIVYFSGHGIRCGHNNCLVPVGEVLTTEDTVLDHTVAAETIVRLLGRDARVTKLLILDACRVNPFVKSMGLKTSGVLSGGLGKAGEMPPSGTLIAYAAAPGFPAYPGEENGRSLFTAALVEALREPNLALTNALGKAGELVSHRTSAKTPPQEPWVEGPLSSRTVILNHRPDLDPDRQRVAALETELKALKAQQAAVIVPASPAPVQPPATQPAVGLHCAPGQVFKDCDQCPEMVVVPAGEFLMGSPDSEPERFRDEGPQHKVAIARPFAAGRFEVTFDEWDACVAGGGCNDYRPADAGAGRDRRPVINVSWKDAQAYVAWLKTRTGKTYRLLTEAEWEYTARAGTTTPFSTGRTITAEQANFGGNRTDNGGAKMSYRKNTVDVGSFQTNAFGLYDMHGNVLEWVEDCWYENYSGAPSDGRPLTTGECRTRVLRGGSWGDFSGYLRSAFRSRLTPGVRDDVSGFRVARTF